MKLQNCKTCKHSRWSLTPTGRIVKDTAGKCALDVRMPPIPACLRIGGVGLMKAWIWQDDGIECPVYESANGDKPKRIDGLEPGY